MEKPAPASTPFRLGYRPELDGLRAIAALTVTIGHCVALGTGADLKGPPVFSSPLVFHGGFFGVDIFFVLSGFLITSLLLQEHATLGRIDFRAFYIRRALRLGPAMALTIAGASLYLIVKGSPVGAFDWLAILYAALYISNFALIFGGLRIGMLTPTWTLAIEEQFYTIWPFILGKLLAVSHRKIFGIVIAAILATWALRASLYAASWSFYSWALFASGMHLIFARADGLLLGVLVAMAAAWGGFARLQRHDRLLKTLGWLCAAALAGILVYGPGLENGALGKWVFLFWYACVSLVTSGLLVSLLAGPPRALCAALRFAPLVWFGKISYGLYLFHEPIYALVPAQALGKYGALALGFGGATALAAFSYYVIELRFLALRHTWGKPRAVATSQPGQAVSRPAFAQATAD